MMPEIVNSIVTINANLAELAAWVRSNGAENDPKWLSAAFGDSAECLEQLLTIAGSSDLPAMRIAESSESSSTLPSLSEPPRVLRRLSFVSHATLA
jgi:hypothetical protein